VAQFRGDRVLGQVGLDQAAPGDRTEPGMGVEQVPGAELVIVGGPKAGHMSRDPEARRLRRHAAERGVADRVRLVGRVAAGEIPAWYRSADLVVCSPWYEPFGIVPLEAMACGVPVVATAVGGLTDSVVNGVTGLHVPPRQRDQLIGALRGLLEDPVRRKVFGAAGRDRARVRFSWQR
jgi:D-inositol-3-phosphate glycosyltransferase